MGISLYLLRKDNITKKESLDMSSTYMNSMRIFEDVEFNQRLKYVEFLGGAQELPRELG